MEHIITNVITSITTKVIGLNQRSLIGVEGKSQVCHPWRMQICLSRGGMNLEDYLVINLQLQLSAINIRLYIPKLFKEAPEKSNGRFNVFTSSRLTTRMHTQLRIPQIHRPDISHSLEIYLNPSFAASMGPMVLPQEESFRTTNLCSSTFPARRAISSMSNIPGEFVA